MEEKIYLGIDVGTTHLKVCAVCGGQIAALSVREEKYIQSPVLGTCMEARQIWADVWECIQEVCGKVRGEICGIGITGMAEACVLLTEDGQAELPVIPWNSGRAASAGPEDFPPKLRGFALYEKTGLIWQPKYTINRLLSMKKHTPKLLEEASAVLSVPDYLLFCLTGEKMTEESLACRTMLYDIFNRRWDEELMSLAGVRGKMPRVVRREEKWPKLRRELAREMGDAAKARVCVAGHDHLCAAAAEGVEDGEVLNSMGTSEIYAGFLPGRPRAEELYPAGIQTGLFADRYYWICNLPSSGGALEWLRRLWETEGEKLSYGRMFGTQGEKPSEVLFLPFLGGGGTHRQEVPPCVLKGMTPDTGLAALIQGVCEGIACESRAILELVAQAQIPAERIVSVGGGTKNRLLMQAKADIAGRNFTVSQNAQASALGAAVRAGASFDPRRAERINISPEAGLAGAYEEKYRRYREEIKRQTPERKAKSCVRRNLPLLAQ